MINTITPCLWFNDQAEEAAKYYLRVFKNSKITSICPYPQDMHDKKAGDVMVVAFELDGQPFTALNGGPFFQLNEAVSFQIECATQEEVDYFWEKLSEGGDPAAQQCGWLKDKFGLSWQIVPKIIPEMMMSTDTVKKQRGFQAMLQMKKLDIAALQRAFEG